MAEDRRGKPFHHFDSEEFAELCPENGVERQAD
jgi:hypothetical protein